MQKVIILRGAPASGKSTIAKSYRNFEKRVAWLKVDNFKDFFSEDSSLALEYVNRAAVATLEYLLDEGFSVVMEGVFQDTRAIGLAEEIAKLKSIPCHIFELAVPLKTLQQRDLTREGVPEGKRPALGNETIEKIFNKLKDNPYPDAIQLNTEKNNLYTCKLVIDNSFQ